MKEKILKLIAEDKKLEYDMVYAAFSFLESYDEVITFANIAKDTKHFEELVFKRDKY